MNLQKEEITQTHTFKFNLILVWKPPKIIG